MKATQYLTVVLFIMLNGGAIYYAVQGGLSLFKWTVLSSLGKRLFLLPRNVSHDFFHWLRTLALNLCNKDKYFTSMKFHCRVGFWRCSSTKPDIPVSLSGTSNFLGVSIATCLVFPCRNFVFLLSLLWKLFSGVFCSKATLMRSIASSSGTNLWNKDELLASINGKPKKKTRYDTHHQPKGKIVIRSTSLSFVETGTK